MKDHFHDYHSEDSVFLLHAFDIDWQSGHAVTSCHHLARVQVLLLLLLTLTHESVFWKEVLECGR